MRLNQLSAIDQCLRHMTTAISTAKLYSIEHKQVKTLCRKALSCLQEAMGEESSLSVMRVDEQLAMNEHPLERSMYVDRFARLIKKKGVGHIKFVRNVSDEELYALITSLASSEIVSHSSENVRLGQVEVRHRTHRGNNSGEHLARSTESDSA